MNFARRQVLAENVASTIRVLELLAMNYEVGAPKNPARQRKQIASCRNDVTSKRKGNSNL
jgi:hypothetical protein